MTPAGTRLSERWEDVEFVFGALRRVKRRELSARVRLSGSVPALRGEIVEQAVDPLFGCEEEAPRRESLRKLAARPDVHVLFLGDPGYPALLAETADPPVILFVRSLAETPSVPGAPLAVALVGSRRGTPYGRQVSERLAADLAGAGVSIVSGLARGVDEAAHRGALAAGGVTVAVLGCGIDVDYPRENGKLAAEIAEKGGAIVTEYPPGTPPLPEHFPERNRIVAGLSEAVCVVEAKERSGSLITARLALEEGREVFGVPGSVLGEGSAGVHRLLRDGARLVTSAADLLADLRPDQLRLLPSKGVPELPEWLRTALSPEEPRNTDELSGRTGKSIPELLVALLDAELGGAVRTAPGGRYLLAP